MDLLEHSLENKCKQKQCIFKIRLLMPKVYKLIQLILKIFQLTRDSSTGNQNAHFQCRYGFNREKYSAVNYKEYSFVNSIYYILYTIGQLGMQ